jgi:hypothetical protein
MEVEEQSPNDRPMKDIRSYRTFFYKFTRKMEEDKVQKGICLERFAQLIFLAYSFTKFCTIEND